MKKKMIYVAPSVRIARVILEGCIAAQSVVTSVKVMDWQYEQADLPENNTDIVLPY